MNIERLSKGLKNSLIRLKALLFSEKRIKVGVSAGEMIGKNYMQLCYSLSKAGFTNITYDIKRDAYDDQLKYIGLIIKSTINGVDCYKAQDRYPYDAEIVITYLEKAQIMLEFDEKFFAHRKYSELKDYLCKLGYTNIRTEGLHDLIVGLFKKDENYAYLTVGGKKHNVLDKPYEFDAPIVLYYHSLKKETH